MKILALLGSLLICAPAHAQLDKLLKKVDKTLNKGDAASPATPSSGLAESTIIAGLRQALQVSTGNAVAATGKPDGFLKNAAIKIVLPPRLQTVAKGLRMVGMGAQVDELEVGMNRAAEQATPKAKQIFLNALVKMTFSDARQILAGGDTAATDYFKRQSVADLTATFTPIVKSSMDSIGVVQQYNRVLASAPGGSALAGKFDLTDYVVSKTLDGLFYMLGEEEKKIRQDPAAQTTALLRQVFGKK